MMRSLISFILLIGLGASCYNSSITHSWKSPKVKPKTYEKIIVVALENINDHELKEKMENHLVNDFLENNVKAVSAVKLYGPKYFDGLNESAAINKIKNDSIDAILTIVLLSKKKEKNYHNNYIRYQPYNYYNQHFWGYYSNMYDRIYEPGYYTENTEYFWESNLYDVGTKELIYSVQTKSFNPSNWNTLAHEYGKIIFEDLQKNNLF